MKTVNRLGTVLTAFIILQSTVMANVNQVTRVGRYSTVLNKPTPSQIDPLIAVAQFKFPAKVQTVGQAISMVLQGTGYCLIDPKHQSEAVQETLTKPLPMTLRSLGPLSIKEALTVLMGKRVFMFDEDPLHRLVNFRVKPAMKQALEVNHVKR